MQTEGLNTVKLSNQDSIGFRFPTNLPSKFVFSFQALMEAESDRGGGGGFRLFLDNTRTAELLNLRFRKNISRIESVQLFINGDQLPAYNVQEFKSVALADFAFLIDTVSWHLKFFSRRIVETTVGRCHNSR